MRSAVAMEVKREKVVLFCALICNVIVPVCFIYSVSSSFGITG